MTADEATIKIAFDMEDIEIKTDSEKLNLLLRMWRISVDDAGLLDTTAL